MSEKGQKMHDKEESKEYNHFQRLQTKEVEGLKSTILKILLISGIVMLGAYGTEKSAAAIDPDMAVSMANRQSAQETTGENNQQIPPQSPALVEYGANIAAFVPDGWKLIKQASGDLNGDGQEDIAGVIEYGRTYQRSAAEEAPLRILFIALKEKSGYHLSIQKEKFILKADEGGVWGDPFDSISVDRGSLVIHFYGGSNYRWAYNYRFRYQNSGWYLIGYTADSWYTGTGSGKREDYNLLTGFEIISTIDKNVVVHEETVNRGKKMINLKDFQPFDLQTSDA